MSTNTGKILAVDDNEDILFALKLLLKQHVEIITTLNDPQKITDELAKEDFDVILLDMNFTKDAISGQEGFDWLARILEIDPDMEMQKRQLRQLKPAQQILFLNPGKMRNFLPPSPLR